MKIFNPLAAQPDNPLTRSVKEGYSPLLFAFAFSLASNLLYLALPLYTFHIYGGVMTSGSIETLMVITVGVLLAFVMSGVIDHYRAKVLINFGVLMDQRVSGHVFAALFQSNMAGTNQAKSQAMRDLDTFRQMLTGSPFGVVFDLPWLPLYMGILFLIDPLVGVVTLLGAALLFGIAVLQDQVTRPPMRDANEAAIKSYGFTDAALRNLEAVRAMGMVEALGKRWASFRQITMDRSSVASDRASLLSNYTKFARQAIQVLIIAIGAYLVIKGKINSGLLFANMILTARALQPIERLVGSWDPLMNGTRAYDRLMKIFEGYRPANVSGTVLPKAKGEVSVEGVNWAPPGSNKFILLGLNFRVEAGEMLGIIGPSGAGKSTLARLLVGIYPPTNGTVRLDGADVSTWDRTDFGRNVGYLPQDTELFSGTIRDNIARFRDGVEDADVIWAAQVAGIHQLILRLPNGYDTDLGDTGQALSAGQRQRVGLARAILGQTKLIVLDEPNASLDAEGEEALMQAMETLKANGATIIVVSHKPTIFRSADKMLVMRDGRMELFGPRDAVMAKVAPTPALRAVEAGR